MISHSVSRRRSSGVEWKLPVSGERILLLVPSGEDQVFLAETQGASLETKLETLQRLAPPVAAGQAASAHVTAQHPAREGWHDLPLSDMDAALLALRRLLFGERVYAEVECAACGSRGDIVFSIAEFFAAHAPVKPAVGNRVRKMAGGWFSVPGAEFRIPLACDLLAAQSEGGFPAQIAAALESRTLRSARDNKRRGARNKNPQRPNKSIWAAAMRNALQALEKMAPLFSGELEGGCHQCKSRVAAWFDVGEYVLAELRQSAAAVFEDVHLIASRYGWGEERILAMPADRRLRYAAMITRDRQPSREETLV
jgi:hypothetical protein